MHVRYVLRYFPTLTETFVYREIRELVSRGVTVDILALEARADGVLQDELPDVPVRYVGRQLAETLRGLTGLRGLPSTDPRELRWALRAVTEGRRARMEGVDRLHVHFAGEAASFARGMAIAGGMPWSVMAHAVDLRRPRRDLPELLAHARPALVVSQAAARRVAACYGIELSVLRCGIDPSRYALASASQTQREALTVVSVARDVPKKGLALLARASARAGAHLRLVSDAPHLARPGVVVGAVAPSKVPAVLAQSDVFALPCRMAHNGDADEIPVSILEAMASGLPVLTTAVGGISEVVDEDVGWLLPSEDVAAWTSALRAAASDPAARQAKGAAARRRILERDLTVARQVTGLLQHWGVA